MLEGLHPVSPTHLMRLETSERAARKVGDHFGLEYWRKQDAAKAFPKEFWRAVCDAGLCGAALPTAVIYILLGRFFIRGILAGSIKG